MSAAIKWRAKRDAQRQINPGCWETESGYTIAECRTPEVRYVITRPGGKAPSFYTPDRLQVAKLIDADERAQA